jgi:hypothetical protein
MGLYHKAKSLFSTPGSYESVSLSAEKHLRGEGIKVPFQELPLQISLVPDDTRLHLYPEFGLISQPEKSSSSFILFNPDHYYSHISAFLRLERGKRLVLGRSDPEQKILLGYSDRVNRRHLSITYLGDTFIFEDLHSNSGTTLSVLRNPDEIERLTCRREAKFYRIREIFEGPIQQLPMPEAHSVLEKVNMILSQEAHRPKNSRSRPGAVVMLPDELTPIVVGDLHVRIDNLIHVLSENRFLESLLNGSASLIMLGDVVHSEIDGHLEDMTGSLLMMDFIFKLKNRFPDQVFHIRGNHDSFSPDVSKGGIPQGMLWEKHVLDERGVDYKREMDRYYDQLPLVVIAKDFLACHASPPFRRVNLKMLINAQEDPALIEQLILNRLKRPIYPGGYTGRDVRRFRNRLGLPPELPFIVGHNPLTERETLWMNAGNIENHHIVYSARPDSVGVFTRVAGKMIPLCYPTEPVRDIINALPEKHETTGIKS